MLIEKVKLWEEEDNKANITSYILDNSPEIRITKRPTVIICPGGAYLGTSDREAEPVAMKFASVGYHTIVLRYNTYILNMSAHFNGGREEYNEKSHHPQPLFDLAKTMLILHENAEKWNIDTENIIVCGFSAGAHLTATLGTHWHDELLKEKFNVDNELFKPKAIILGYPVTDYIIMKENAFNSSDKMIKGLWEVANKALFGEANPSDKILKSGSPSNYVSSNTPPTFIWHTANDELVHSKNSLKFAMALAENNIPYELHVFEDGVHGLSLCDETTARVDNNINPECAVWFELAIKWLKKHK